MAGCLIRPGGGGLNLGGTKFGGGLNLGGGGGGYTPARLLVALVPHASGARRRELVPWNTPNVREQPVEWVKGLLMASNAIGGRRTTRVPVPVCQASLPRCLAERGARGKARAARRAAEGLGVEVPRPPRSEVAVHHTPSDSRQRGRAACAVVGVWRMGAPSALLHRRCDAGACFFFLAGVTDRIWGQCRVSALHPAASWSALGCDTMGAPKQGIRVGTHCLHTNSGRTQSNAF